MLKYGSLNNVSNQNSKTLLPRNLTYNYALNTSSTNINVINNSSNNELLEEDESLPKFMENEGKKAA
jgi:hypothetical protein